MFPNFSNKLYVSHCYCSVVGSVKRGDSPSLAVYFHSAGVDESETLLPKNVSSMNAVIASGAFTVDEITAISCHKDTRATKGLQPTPHNGRRMSRKRTVDGSKGTSAVGKGGCFRGRFHRADDAWAR